MNKKKYLLIIFSILAFFIVIFCYINYIYVPFKRKTEFENSLINFYQNNQKSDFSISKMIFYSSAYGKNKNTNFDGNNWILDIYQYTDLAFYIKPSSENNFVKSVWIDNLEIVKKPTLGNVSIYYEDALRFGTEYISTNYQFADRLDFTVVNDTNVENDIKYNTPIFFSDCSTPISLKFVNNLANDLTLKNITTITQNGTILSHAINNVSVIEASFKFTVHLIDIHDIEHTSTLTINVPLENESNNIITNGNIVKIIDNLNLNLLENK